MIPPKRMRRSTWHHRDPETSCAMRLNKWTHEIPIARVHHLIDIRAQTAVIINELKSLKRQKTTHLAGHGFQRLSATNHFSTLQHISAHEPLLRSFTKPIVLKHLHYYFSCCSLFFVDAACTVHLNPILSGDTYIFQDMLTGFRNQAKPIRLKWLLTALQLSLPIV